MAKNQQKKSPKFIEKEKLCQGKKSKKLKKKIHIEVNSQKKEP